MSEPDFWILQDGTVLGNVHHFSVCEGQGCPIHHPSRHSMVDFPLHWRDDRKLMERTCPHGVGHPDPDDLAYRATVIARAESVHGCCGNGCCS